MRCVEFNRAAKKQHHIKTSLFVCAFGAPTMGMKQGSLLVYSAGCKNDLPVKTRERVWDATVTESVTAATSEILHALPLCSDRKAGSAGVRSAKTSPL